MIVYYIVALALFPLLSASVLMYEHPPTPVTLIQYCQWDMLKYKHTQLDKYQCELLSPACQKYSHMALNDLM